jgi:hypothetical protein
MLLMPQGRREIRLRLAAILGKGVFSSENSPRVWIL